MGEKSFNELQPVSFGARLANSQVFADLFRDGMALVEETATYLDGAGRQESKHLERAAALAYATESMRLTTRLMQLASWLLLHRAVKEGEMSLAQANKEKAKVKLSAADYHDPTNLELLPATLRELIERSHKLQAKVRRLDATIHNQNRPRTGRGGQSGRAPARPAESGLRRGERLTDNGLRDQTKPPREAGVFRFARETWRAYFFSSAFRKPENFFWKRDRRPPRSSKCCWPPVQAGCDFGSMSRCMTSPSLPQVERVVNSLPSVITTLMV